jgi:K+-sensing histidine kinase KdpD
VDLEKEPVLVLVTMQHACARLIREGVDLALREGRPVKVLHVVNPDAAPIGEPAINAQALDYLYALSGEAGAEMCVLTSNVPVTAIANYATDCGTRHVIMGGGGQACGIAETLSQLLPGVRVMILERE